MKSVFLIAVVMLASSAAQASEIPKIPIFVDGTARTVAGKDFIFEVKEQFRSSSRLQVSASDNSFYKLRLAVLEIDSANIAYSAVWTFRGADKLDIHSNHLVGICAIMDLQRCARSLLAVTDEQTTVDWERAMEGLELKPPAK